MIAAACPECRTTYRLKPEMAGKRMRCTDAECRAVFLVEAATKPELVAAASSTPPLPVGLPIEEPAPEFDWRDAPPPPADEALETPELNHPNRHQIVAPPVVAGPFPAPPPPQKSSRRLLVMGLGIFVLSGVAWGVTTIVQRFARAEERLAGEAAQAFAKAEFGKASERYAALAAEYPRAVCFNEYRFLSDLAKVRRQAMLVPPMADDAFTVLSQFVKDQESGPFLKDKRVDVYLSALKTFDDLVNDGKELVAEKKPEAASTKEKLARQALAIVERYAPAGTDSGSLKRRVDELTSALGSEKAKALAKEQIFKLLRLDRPDVETAQALIRRAGFANDPAIKLELTRAMEKLRGLVTYEEKHVAAQPSHKINSTGLLPGPKAIGPGPRLLTIANGVLAALDSKTGRIAWADRVGADASWPPIKLDESRWLIVSTEPLAITARDATSGDVLWAQPLESMPVGPPAIVAGRVFVAMAGAVGAVLSFDARSGEMLGTFVTGQPLAGGIGVRPGSTKMYVPARAQQVYVLDAMPDDGPPRCVATMTTGHMPGSLRREPTIVPLNDGGTGLLLETSDGLADTALELFRLSDGLQPSISVVLDRTRVPGWTWFPPSFNAERLATIGDRGVLGVFGLRQAAAADGPMFGLGDGANSRQATSPQRSMVFIADDDSMIAIAGGWLRQWRLVIDRLQGRKLAQGWSHGENIGVPVQPPLIESGIAYLTTQRSDPPATMVTAVRIDVGEILWQRPIGFDFSVPPVRVENTTIAVDHHGALMALPADDVATGWNVAGKELAGPVPGLDARPSFTKSAPNRWTSVLPATKNVLLRHLSSNMTISDQRIELPASLAGQIGFAPAATVLPLANGVLVRVASEGKPVAGPTWRTAGSGPDSIGHVTHWHGDTFLVGDGHYKLMRLKWGADNLYDLATTAALERPIRIIGSPVIVPGDIPRAVIGDGGGNVILILGDKLEIERQWRLGGDGRTLSSRPILLGNQLFAVINNKSVVVLNPDRDAPSWHFDLPDGTIVGEPMEFGDKIVVADSVGRIWLLEANTGKPTLADGFRLSGCLVAASTPVIHGANRLFVPLTDGTAITVTLGQLAGQKS